MSLAAAIALGALEVLAQTPREQAARLGARAQEACVAGRHDEALRLYEEVFRLRPQARRDYFVGIEQQHLDRPVEAVQAFERYLEAPGGEPEYVADAVSRRNELRSRLGELELVSLADEAEVLVDGEPRTPGSGGRVPVRAGLRRVVVRQEGFLPLDTSVRVAAGARVAVPAALRPREAGTAAPPPPPAVIERPPEPAPVAVPRRDLELNALLGGGVWMERDEAPETVALALGGSCRLAGERLQLRAGARATLGTLADKPGHRALSLGLLAAPILRYEAAPDGLAIELEAGAGVGVLSGVEVGSLLLKNGASEVTGPLGSLALRPALTLEYPISPALAARVSGALLWTPTPSDFFVHRSLTRFDLAGGISVRF
jgi:hypothetical protein